MSEHAIIRLVSDDEICFVRISMRVGGAMAVEGHISDTKMVLQMLAAAADLVRSQVKETRLILVPPRDVEVKEYAHPHLPLGDMPRKDWGDR